MAVDYRKPGTIEPIYYWQNQKGHAMLMPTSEMLGMERMRRYMDKLGYVLMAAETLKEAEKLQKKLQDQLKREQEAELERDEQVTAYRRKQIDDRLKARQLSSSTNEFEREFIRIYREGKEKRRELFQKRFTQQVGHLDALEFDNPTAHMHSMLDKT